MEVVTTCAYGTSWPACGWRRRMGIQSRSGENILVTLWIVVIGKLLTDAGVMSTSACLPKMELHLAGARTYVVQSAAHRSFQRQNRKNLIYPEKLAVHMAPDVTV